MRNVMCSIVACLMLLAGELSAQISYPEIKKVYEKVDGTLSIESYARELKDMDEQAAELVRNIVEPQEKKVATLIWHAYQRGNIYRFWKAIGGRQADVVKLRAYQLSVDPDVPEMELLSTEDLNGVLDGYFRLNKFEDSYWRMKECLYGIKSEKVRNAYALALLERELQVNGMGIEMESVFEVFRCCSKTPETVERVDELEKMYAPVRGEGRAPEIVLPDDKGNIFRLSDFREKYVFMCVWSLDSVNGINELDTFAEAKKVNDKWGEAGIMYVNIAVGTGKDQDKWEKMLGENKHSEWMVNLFCDKSKSTFAQDYVIDSLPRYIFVETEGCLRSAWFVSPDKRSLFKRMFRSTILKYNRIEI